ncbi:hypothetical protein [Microbacterium hydrocarbonoxydans]|nr:hypothetical protein [Microbacterium hydrocarbonoxydans]
MHASTGSATTSRASGVRVVVASTPAGGLFAHLDGLSLLAAG